MAHGGSRAGAGKPKGSKSKKTIALDEVSALQAKSDYVSPVKFLLDVMKDNKQDVDIRVEAAKAAAPYTNKKKPADIHVAGADGLPLSVEITTPTPGGRP